MDYQQFEQKVTGQYGWLIALVLVAGSAYLLGNSRVPKSQTVVSDEAITQPTNTTIADIQTSLSQDPETAVENVESASETSGLININTATTQQLDKLPGIGPTKAQAIIQYRNQNGNFVRVEDLANVKGIGPKTVEQLRDLVTL